MTAKLNLPALLRRTPIRWLLLAYYLILLAVTLATLSFGLHTMLGRFLFYSNESRLRTTAEAGWFMDSEEEQHLSRKEGLPAPRDYPANAEELARRMSGRGVFVRVLDANGRILAEAGRSKNAPPVDLEQINQLPQSNRGRLSYLINTDKGEWQVLLLPVMREGKQVGVVQICGINRPAREMLAALSGYLGLGGSLAMLLAVILTLGLTRFFAYPLERLKSATARVRSGDLSARTGLKPGTNEVYAVAEAFDAMVGQLQETFESQRRFVADASHELKTPLTAIGGMAELLRVGADRGKPEQRELALRTIEKEVDRMSALVSDLLTLSRAEQTAPPLEQLVDLKPLLEEVVSQSGQLSPQHGLTLEVATPLVVRGDSEQLDRVLRNLVDNAIQYSPQGGSVRVKGESQGKVVQIEVTDYGVGIDEKDISHIFDRFYRADDSRARKTGGSGLGLAIVRALIEQHRGQVAVTSRLGQGSTFTVRLPAGGFNE